MNLNQSAHKEIIGKHFDYSFDFDFLDLVADLLERVDDIDACDPYEGACDAVDSGLIYTADEWKVLQFYCTPKDASLQTALENLIDDLASIICKIQG